MDSNVCRVCMISSEVFYYCSLLTEQIFKNIRLCEAFELITGLNISKDDRFPTVICFRCEKQLRNAYHFRQLAESSSKHFASIQQTNSSNQSTPRILNAESRSADGHPDVHPAKKRLIETKDENNEDTVKSEYEIESRHRDSPVPVVYVVDVNGSDVEVKRQSPSKVSGSRESIMLKKRSRSRVASQSTNTSNTHAMDTKSKCDKSESFERIDDNQDEDSDDAISFLLQNKHLKNDDNNKDEAYQRRKYECTVCGKKFVGKSNLVDHLRYHANIRNFKCDFCEKTFVQSGSLKSHLRTHTSEKPYVCCYCNKSFGQKSALTVHIRTHTQERKFVCDICSKAFMTTGDLIKHKLIHDSVKRFACDICGMRSAQKVNIKKHRLNVHGITDDVSTS